MALQNVKCLLLAVVLRRWFYAAVIGDTEFYYSSQLRINFETMLLLWSTSRIWSDINGHEWLCL